MKKIFSFIPLFVFISILSISPAQADSIKLKNGRILEGTILNKTDKYVEFDFMGVKIKYDLKDVENIEYSVKQEPQPQFEHRSLITAPASGTAAKEPEQLFQEVSPAVVFITTEQVVGPGALGSGFIIDKQGVVVTNFHVVRETRNLNIRLKDGRTIPVTGVIHYDVVKDFCILKTDGKDLPSISLGDSDRISIGEKLYAIGNPLGYEYSFSDGILSGTRIQSNIKWLQFTVPISPGNSGGPLFNAKGQVLGIVTKGYFEGAQNLNFALAINYIKPYIGDFPKMTFQEFVDKVSQPLSYCSQGFEFIRQNNNDEAKYNFEKALKIDPNLVDAYFGLGLVYESSQQYEKAIENYMRAIEIDPEYIQGYLGLGFDYVFLNQFDKAINYLQKALEIDPEQPVVYNNLGFVYSSLRQYQQAVVYYQKSLELDPSNVSTYVYLAQAHYYLDHLEEALPLLQRAIQIDPYSARAYYGLGRLYISLRKLDLARKNLNIAIDLFETQGDYESAREVRNTLNNDVPYK